MSASPSFATTEMSKELSNMQQKDSTKKNSKSHDEGQASVSSEEKGSSGSSNSKQNSEEVSESAIPYTLETLSNGLIMASFHVPSHLRQALITTLVSCRGAMFELKLGKERGVVTCTFESPKPHLTATAIAERLAARVEDPNRKCLLSIVAVRALRCE
jgi:hypothetical protein